MRKVLGYFSEFSIFAIVGSILIVGPLNFGSREADAQALLHLGAIALLPFWMIRLVCLAEPVFVWTRVTLPALAFAGYVLVWYACSDVKWLARQEFLMVLTYLILFLVVVNNLQRRWQLQALFWVIAAVAGAEAADAIFRHYHGNESTVCRFFFWDCIEREGFQNRTRAGGTFYTSDHFSAYLEIGLVLIAAHLVVLKRSWTRKVFLIYLGACILYGIALSRSRGGWITVLCVVPFLAVLVVRGRFLNSRSALVGALVLIGVVAFLYTKHGLVSERFNDLLTQGEPTRLKFYRAALEIGKEHPLFGVGPRMFNAHFHRLYALQENPEFVHSEFLQAWADYGIVGVGLLGWLLFMVYRSALQMSGPKGSEPVSNVSKDVSQRLALVLGGTAAAFAITVHALFDFVLHVMGVTVTLVVAVAMMYAGAALRRKRSETEMDAFGFEQAFEYRPLSSKMQWVTLGILGIGFVFFFQLSLRNFLAMRYEQQAESVMVKADEWADPDAARAVYEKAARIDSGSYRAAYSLANYYYAHGGDDPEGNRAAFDQVLHWYSKAIQLNPYLDSLYLARVPLWLAIGDTGKARSDCEQLTTHWPHNPQYRMMHGELCFMEADYECAREQFELAKQLAEKSSSQTSERAKNYLEILKDVPRPEDADSN